MKRFDDEPCFLADRRLLAAARALELPLPDRSLHRFRFTDPAALMPSAGVASALAVPSPPWTVEVEVSPEALASGVSVLDFPTALARMPALVAEHLGRIAPPDDAFLALNLATFSGGAVVHVPAGVVVPAPIVLRVRPGSAEGAVACGRTLVLVDAGATATVLEEMDLAAGLGNAVTEAILGAGATLVHGRFETVARGAASFSRACYSVGRDASLTHAHVLLPSGLIKAEAVPILAGTGARSEGLVLSLAGGRARSDFRAVEDHAVGDTESRVIYRAVALGRGRTTFTGLLKIREGAARSAAYEEARSLLLSRTASADVLPELEILNHDVRCTHGAAVAPVDEDAVFYLRTRGLSRDEAEALLVEGFVEAVASRFPSEALADRARARLREELALARGVVALASGAPAGP
jgi:Fe-S cluster assembly protein SufD